MFWGAFKPKQTGQTLGFHIYSLYARELNVNRGAKCHLALDVFSLDKKPHHINRVFLTYKYARTPTTYSVSFTWMDPKYLTFPLLIVKSFSKGTYGPLGIEHYVAFFDDWGSWTSVTNLNFGAWHASDTIGQTNRLTIDQGDLLEVQAKVHPAGEYSPEEIAHNYSFGLHWNWDLINFARHAENREVLERYFKRYQ